MLERDRKVCMCQVSQTYSSHLFGLSCVGISVLPVNGAPVTARRDSGNRRNVANKRNSDRLNIGDGSS